MADRSHLSEQEIDIVIRSMKCAVNKCSSQATVTLYGVIDFVSILVEFMELGHEALVAGVFHYCSCIKVLERDGMSDSMPTNLEPERAAKSTPSSITAASSYIDFDTKFLLPLAGSGIEKFGPDAVRIALDTARLKGTESVAAAVLNDSRTRQRRPTTSQLSSTSSVLRIRDAENLKSLLLAANAGGEWRALAIRCAACLYRLRGLQSFREQMKQPDWKHPPLILEEVRVAREALYIFSPLAHRLGMYRLKSELEGVAFRVLYRRQYDAVMSLLRDRLGGSGGTNKRGIPVSNSESPLFFADFEPIRMTNSDSIDAGMKSVLEDITSRAKRILQEDETMMEHVSELKITARIKEPYSLWRKLLSIHAENVATAKAAPNRRKRPVLSVLQVPDAVALRVILRARKLTTNEDDDITSGRERALCYYAQQLCMKHLSPTPDVATDKRLKDYIANPKKNGYQSLHYSSKMRWHGEAWPFEVQSKFLHCIRYLL